jgi:hypothetical protein
VDTDCLERGCGLGPRLDGTHSNCKKKYRLEDKVGNGLTLSSSRPKPP